MLIAELLLQQGRSGELFVPVLAGLFALLPAWWIVRGVRHILRSRRVSATDAIPVNQIPTMSAGQTVEISGTARTLSRTVTGHGSGEECLVYEYSAAPTDDKSKQTIREEVPFLVEDDSGVTVVDPEGAHLTLSRTQRDHRLDPNETVHVIGEAQPDAGGPHDETDRRVQGNVAADQITDSDEGKTARRLYAGGVRAILAGFIGLGVILALLWRGGYLPF